MDKGLINAVDDFLARGNFSIGAAVADKMKVATHFRQNEYVQYYGVPDASHETLLQIQAVAIDAGETIYLHEVFSERFALVFDIDGHEKGKELKDILCNIYRSMRDIFVIDPQDLTCLVFSASDETKMSYHIHFPYIIVNKHTCMVVYENIFKRDKTMRDYIDEQIISSGKLRMAFSDKYKKPVFDDKGQLQTQGGPAHRALRYYGTFDYRGEGGRRIFPEYENDTLQLLKLARVRRKKEELLTDLRCVRDAEQIPLNSKLQYDDIDLEPHDDMDFSKLPPEYYSIYNDGMQVVIEYISSKYGHKSNFDPETMKLKITKFLNNIVTMITDHPGKTIFLLRAYVRGRHVQKWNFIQKNQKDFLLMFEHLRVIVPIPTEKGLFKTRLVSIGQIWMEHPEKKCKGKIVFDPRPTYTQGRDVFNIYSGLSLTVDKCKIDVLKSKIDYKDYIKILLRHIFDIWCNENDTIYQYVIKWLAHAVLKPWIKMGVALVLVGAEGVGKSKIVEALGQIYGKHYLHITDMEDLLGKFNSHLADKLFVFADEAVPGNCKSLSGKLKGLLTEPSLRCEHKGFDTYYVDNYSNFIFASNNDHAIQAGESSRRFMCLNCTSKYRGNYDHFKELDLTRIDYH